MLKNPYSLDHYRALSMECCYWQTEKYICGVNMCCKRNYKQVLKYTCLKMKSINTIATNNADMMPIQMMIVCALDDNNINQRNEHGHDSQVFWHCRSKTRKGRIITYSTVHESRTLYCFSARLRETGHKPPKTYQQGSPGPMGHGFGVLGG